MCHAKLTRLHSIITPEFQIGATSTKHRLYSRNKDSEYGMNRSVPRPGPRRRCWPCRATAWPAPPSRSACSAKLLRGPYVRPADTSATVGSTKICNRQRTLLFSTRGPHPKKATTTRREKRPRPTRAPSKAPKTPKKGHEGPLGPVTRPPMQPRKKRPEKDPSA